MRKWARTGFGDRDLLGKGWIEAIFGEVLVVLEVEEVLDLSVECWYCRM